MPMRSSIPLVLLVLSSLLVDTQAEGLAGAYILFKADNAGLGKLQDIARNASNVPFNRVFVAFFGPDLIYKSGSNTLKGTGLNVPASSDYGFSQMKQAVSQLQKSGVQVFLSMGGWNFNCWPALYARYSINYYGAGPNFWKINEYGGGNIDNCDESNMWCYTCEPPTQHAGFSSFKIFPEPGTSKSWAAAIQAVNSAASSKGMPAPAWHPEMIPGQKWTDPVKGDQLVVPGSGAFFAAGQNPYEDFVALAADLGVAGIDLDYEEIWHADTFKVAARSDESTKASYPKGPWKLTQTAYKYAAIVQNFKDAITNSPTSSGRSLRLSTAAGAAGALSTPWWGGNLKGLWYEVKSFMPELTSFMTQGANAGGINVMTYDLSDNARYHECPSTNLCTLPQQVEFYMKSYEQAGVWPAAVGFEVGTPAFPDPTHDPSHTLPLTTTDLRSILSDQPEGVAGAFFWEMYKPANGTEADASQVAQAVCKQFVGSGRCAGSIPTASSASNIGDDLYPRH